MVNITPEEQRKSSCSARSEVVKWLLTIGLIVVLFAAFG